MTETERQTLRVRILLFGLFIAMLTLSVIAALARWGTL